MAASQARSPVSIRQPNPAARIRLFCFPYAGGGNATYRDWPQRLPGDIEVAAEIGYFHVAGGEIPEVGVNLKVNLLAGAAASVEDTFG